jgi:hypothetical protein
MRGYTSFQILDNKHGRFGNQLFRIATMVGQALKNNCSFYVPSEWEHSQLFPNLPYFSKNEISLFLNKVHQETKFGYHQIPEPKGVTELVGYFQSSVFFDEYKNNIKKILEINSDVLKRNEKKINQSTKKLSIHVRWGDPYDRSVGGGHKGVETKHPTMTLNYYYNSLDFILSKTNIDEIIVFTDNEDTKEFIFGKFDHYRISTTYFDYNQNYIDDFVCQTMCDHFIIANSTFSWWSAYLSENNEKIVCCPKSNEWFGIDYKNLDTSTITPNDWFEIKQ